MLIWVEEVGILMRFKEVCPRCFGECGHSNVMKDAGSGVFECTKDPSHKFKKDENGYWKKV